MTNSLAVLVSGIFRNFDEVWPRNEEILNRLNCSYKVFFHTWESNPSMSAPVLEVLYRNRFVLQIRKKAFKNFKTVILEEDIKRNFDFHFVTVEKFDPSKVSKRFNLDTSECNFLLNSQLNSCGMYLGIEALRIELENEGNYSHFLRLRTDFLLEESKVGEIFSHDLVFFGQLLPTPEGLVGDQCFFWGGAIDPGVAILKTLDSLSEMTSSAEWFEDKVQALPENVIRHTLRPLRRNLDILFLDGAGSISRPSIQNVPLLESPMFIFELLIHNLRVLVSKISIRVNQRFKSSV